MAKISLANLAAEFTRMKEEMPRIEEEALRKAAEFAEEKAKGMFGEYQEGWPELAEATKADRVRQGFSEDEPLLRTGELKDSYGTTVEERSAHIGSNDPRAEWIETGTLEMPPRPALLSVLAQHGDEIAHIVGQEVAMKLGGREK